MSVTAIKQALELSLPGSVVYVFTDAEAKDHRMLPDVIRLIRQKSIRVNFILTGNCGLDKNSMGKDTYEKISILSSGQIVNLNKSEVGTIWEFVEKSVNPKRKNIYSVDKFTKGEKTYFIQIEKNINQALFTVTGEDVEVIIRDSWGALVSLQDRNVDALLNLNSVVSVLVWNPKPGNWSITVRSIGKQTLRVEAISDRWEEATSDHTVVVIPGIRPCWIMELLGTCLCLLLFLFIFRYFVLRPRSHDTTAESENSTKLLRYETLTTRVLSNSTVWTVANRDNFLLAEFRKEQLELPRTKI